MTKPYTKRLLAWMCPIVFLVLTNLTGAVYSQGPWESDQRVVELPAQVKTFLTKAEELTIRMEAVERDGKMVAMMHREYEPNRAAVIKDAEERTRFLDKLFVASTSEFMGAVCYLPSHSIEARIGDQFVNIEICFGCSKYVVTGSFGKFYGTIAREQESESAFNNILLQD